MFREMLEKQVFLFPEPIEASAFVPDGLPLLEHLSRRVQVNRQAIPDAELLISWSRLPAREWDFFCLPR